MKNEGLLSISELANFARISRTALIHYDHMGLISPVTRGENNYRYYSHHQIPSINLIVTLQGLDVPLREIMSLLRNRTPENIVDLFSEQSAHINVSIEKLQRAQKLLLTLKSVIEEVVGVDEEKIELHEAEEEHILLGPQNDYSNGTSIEEATLNFYKYCQAKFPGLDMNYPVWGMYTEERLKRGDWVGPDKFYFKMPDAPHRKPAGLYVTGYARGNYGATDALYKRLLAYIKEQGLKVCGPAFETYPLNEISVANPDNYLIRLSITVKKR
ncbi:MAG: MerR family DNA-binding transcriptional regulator [Synergistaceae bacterium]|jgi:DNA-binding transcriptional MerR regulator|nr:MerR family DNA-binding transcriptional regulator [Synergistaceae bacterium]